MSPIFYINIAVSLIFLIVMVVGMVGTKILQKRGIGNKNVDNFEDDLISNNMTDEEENLIIDEMANDLLSHGYEDQIDDDYVDYIDEEDDTKGTEKDNNEFVEDVE